MTVNIRMGTDGRCSFQERPRFMPSEILPQERVQVQQEPHCFIVSIDAQPVLRCTERRDALRYAVIVRRALQRGDRLQHDGASSSPRSAGARKIRR